MCNHIFCLFYFVSQSSDFVIAWAAISIYYLGKLIRVFFWELYFQKGGDNLNNINSMSSQIIEGLVFRHQHLPFEILGMSLSVLDKAKFFSTFVMNFSLVSLDLVFVLLNMFN